MSKWNNIRVGNLEARIFDISCIGNISYWLSFDLDDLFFTSSILPYPCTTYAFNRYYNSHVKKGAHEFFSVYSINDGQYIGHFEIKNIVSSSNSGTLSHVILGDRRYRGVGYGKEFVKLMAKVGFEYLNLYRLGLSVHVCNPIATAAYIRGGFVFEGVIRDAVQRDKKRFSLYQMSLLRHEWNSAE